MLPKEIPEGKEDAADCCACNAGTTSPSMYSLDQETGGIPSVIRIRFLWTRTAS